ncbi:MAG: hypothetical protein K5866_09895 [Treponema sp.]|nr:hypothetical protein [Treponema sp.]
MKKVILFFLMVFVFSTVFLSAQDSAKSANKNTAIRCYKLAESCMVGKDWQNALNQAELGLSYDDSISDLIYIKATAKINLGHSKNEVIKIIKEAFDKNNWISYSQTGARILYADLLSDEGFYKESLSVLDAKPLLFSADAEIIRIKNYYRIATPDSYNQARLKINSSRRVYSSDQRFENIFFLYELMLKKNAYLEGESSKYDSELLEVIANSYLAKYPNYNANSELEIYAAFFAQGDLKDRLISAIAAKGNVQSPLFPILALTNEFYSQEDAVLKFFDNSKNEINLDLLEVLSKQLTQAPAIKILIEKLNEFGGRLFIDCDSDLQNEFVVDYSLGRPIKASYDSNNDDVKDLIINFDYGVALDIKYSNPCVDIEYGAFPAVKTIKFNDEDCRFDFLYDDFIFTPISVIADPFISFYDISLSEEESADFEFYIPRMDNDKFTLTKSELMTKTVCVTLPITERYNSVVEYTLLQGQLKFAKFFEDDKQYAYCDFESGLPFTRLVDQDFDGYFETTEYYDIYNPQDNIKYDDNNLIREVFSLVADSQNIYLKEVRIDRNANAICEYTEEFLGNDGRIACWDYDDNGVVDLRYKKNPHSEENPSKSEEVSFYNSKGDEIVKMILLDDIPIQLFYQGKEIMIFAGKNNNFYWLEEELSADYEEEILSKATQITQEGKITLLKVKDKEILVIRVFDDYYCKISYPSDPQLLNPENSENKIE